MGTNDRKSKHKSHTHTHTKWPFHYLLIEMKFGCVVGVFEKKCACGEDTYSSNMKAKPRFTSQFEK